MGLFHKIMIANRGEIAVRIIRTARRLGIKTVAVFAEDDQDALHVRMSDECHLLEGDHLNQTYLNIQGIINIAIDSGVEAIHPGYGFLSENPDFAAACEKNRITFIGPSTEAIRLMGNKISSRTFVESLGVPVLRMITGNKSNQIKEIHKIDFPLLVKAAGGGGGKGMRIVHTAKDLEMAIQAAAREAKSYFDNDEVYLEKYIEEPRHIEIQIIADQHGNVIHIFERECSIQRRYQKIIEESPAVIVPEKIREKIQKDAITIAKAMKYSNAGTIEFLVDQELNHYFLEMNTRLQVEHPVTEMTTGLDLVEEQIFIASGEKLRIIQEEVAQSGHAMECRIYAEDPGQQFMPSPGNITFYQEPVQEYTRVDSGIDTPGIIRSNYDPMIGKLIVWGKDRVEAMDRMQNALFAYIIHGVKHNIPFLKSVIQHPAFVANDLSTIFCEKYMEDILGTLKKEKEGMNAEIALLFFLVYQFRVYEENLSTNASVWQEIGYWRHLMKLHIKMGSEEIKIYLLRKEKKRIHLKMGNSEKYIDIISIKDHQVLLDIDGRQMDAIVSVGKNGMGWVSVDGKLYEFKCLDKLPEDRVYSDGIIDINAHSGKIVSPLPGKIVKIYMGKDSKIKKGDVLLVVESMKMENNLIAPFDGIIKLLHVRKGQMIDSSEVLLELIPSPMEDGI